MKCSFNVVVVISISLLVIVNFQTNVLWSLFFPTMIGERPGLQCSHLRSIYSLGSKRHLQSKTNPALPTVIPQRTIGLCINFNYDPDVNANTLRSLLMYYTLMHQYVVILTPSPLTSLSKSNQAILQKYNVVALTPMKPQMNRHVRLNVPQNINGTLFHLDCVGTDRGFYQHVCMSLCAQFFQQQPNLALRGALYLPDDIFFNFTMILTNPAYYNLDEFWISPATALVDATNGKSQASAWYWWHVNDNWNRFHDVFFVKKAYSDILTILYGPKRLLVSALADIVYIPVADNQMELFVNVTDVLMTLYPNVFCEIIISILVDITSALCGHWPYQHDRTIFHSTANRLNNLTNMKYLEKRQRVLHALDPFNSSQYQRRPGLLNLNGSMWGSHRTSETLYRKALFTGRSPFLNQTDDNQIDYIHPMKLSTNTTWQYQLWHEAMIAQIHQLNDLQLHCL